MTYIQDAIAAVNAELPDLDPELTRLYALLALSTGQTTTWEDVHNAWAIWADRTRPDHRSILPFDELAESTQELDAPYTEAIHRAVRKLGGADVAEVRIESRTDGGTYVEVHERCDERALDERPEVATGRLLDEAVRRTRAALGLPGYPDQPAKALRWFADQEGGRWGQTLRRFADDLDAALAAEESCSCTVVYDPGCPDHGDRGRRRSTDR